VSKEIWLLRSHPWTSGSVNEVGHAGHNLNHERAGREEEKGGFAKAEQNFRRKCELKGVKKRKARDEYTTPRPRKRRREDEEVSGPTVVEKRRARVQTGHRGSWVYF